MRRKEKFFGTPLAVARGASGWHAEEPALQFSCLRWWGLGRAGQWRNTIWLCSLSSQLLQLCGHEGCQDVFLALSNHETPHITPFPVRKAPEQLRSSGCALKLSWLHGDLISKSYLKKMFHMVCWTEALVISTRKGRKHKSEVHLKIRTPTVPTCRVEN